LLADVEYHCLSEATDTFEALVVSEEILIFLLRPAFKRGMPEASLMYTPISSIEASRHNSYTESTMTLE
jgi:hypothetical protein